MKTNRNNTSRLLLATAGLWLLGSSAHAALFIYNAHDLILGFRQDGAPNNLEINLGQVTQFYNLAPGATIPVGNAALLGSTFTSLANLKFSVSGAVGESGGFDGRPKHTLWVTRPRADALTQSTPWTQKSQFSQGNVKSKIVSIGDNAVTYSQVNGAYSTSELVIPATSPIAYSAFIGSAGDFGGTFQGNVENLAPNPFSSLIRSDLYELRPASGGPGTYLGYFQLSPSGAMSFTAVPEPGTWAVAAAGGLLVFALYRRQAVARCIQ